MCGIVGAYLLKDYGKIGQKSLENNNTSLMGDTVLRLLRLNENRGDDGYGITTTDGKILETLKFAEINEGIEATLRGFNDQILGIIGHVRYPTSGENKGITAMQPFHCQRKGKDYFSFAFNGNIANADDLAKKLEKKGYEFKMGGLDTEVLKFMIMDIMKKGTKDPKAVLEKAMLQIDGSCNIALVNKKGDMAIAKDLNDFHPLAWTIKDGMFIFSSESSALNAIGCSNSDIHFLAAGEVVKIKKGIKSESSFKLPVIQTPCVFEKLYFSDPNSSIHGEAVSQIRRSLGRQLALEEKNEVDRNNSVVVEVPDSSRSQAKGFATELNIPMVTGTITKNPDINRTFTAQLDTIVDKVKEKYIFNPLLKKFIEGKDVYLIDDSIVRGNTMVGLIDQFKKFYKPRSIHIRIPSPPVVAPCFYGINMKTTKELLAPKYMKDLMHPTDNEKQEISDFLGSASINYLSIKGLAEVVGDVEVSRLEIKGACLACLTGLYPTQKGRSLYVDAL